MLIQLRIQGHCEPEPIHTSTVMGPWLPPNMSSDRSLNKPVHRAPLKELGSPFGL